MPVLSSTGKRRTMPEIGSLVNNAAATARGNLDDTDLALFDRTLAIADHDVISRNRLRSVNEMPTIRDTLSLPSGDVFTDRKLKAIVAESIQRI